jgi:CopG antitoxin of type II toxin-antitoxin system
MRATSRKSKAVRRLSLGQLDDLMPAICSAADSHLPELPACDTLFADLDLSTFRPISAVGAEYVPVAASAARTSRTTRISIRVPNYLLEQVRRQAAKHNLPYQRLLIQALHEASARWR